MSSAARLLVRTFGEETAAEVAEAGFAVENDLGAWLDVGDHDERVAADLSTTLGTTTVHWLIHTVTDLIAIRCFVEGEEVRALTYSSDDGWTIEGEPRPFEAKAALRKWLRKRRLHATPDGYEVLDCFLGIAPTEEAPKKIDEPGATATLYLPVPLATEALSLAKKRGVPVAAILTTAWEIGKAAVFEQRVAEDGPVDLAPPAAPAPNPTLVHSASAVPALAMREDDTLKCALALPPSTVTELERMQRAFGHPMKWLLRDAYLVARPQLGLG